MSVAEADISQRLLNQSVTCLKGVGDQLAAKLSKLGISTLQDLLFHLPARYQDRTHVTPIGALQPQQPAVIQGEIVRSDIAFGKRRSLVCVLQDHSGRIVLRFYHFSNAQKQNLSSGTRLQCFGETRRGASGLEMYHPETKHIGTEQQTDLPQTLTPIYPITEGLSQSRLRALIQQALKAIDQQSVPDLLPTELLTSFQQHDLLEALRYLHQPDKNAPLISLAEGRHPLQQRLAFEELLAHHLSLLQLRAAVSRLTATALPPAPTLQQQFIRQLPFTLTAAQQRVAAEIEADLAKPHPMMRLVQGDVGSGKTAVAALAALRAIGNGKQVAIMAPTEILAEQHRANFSEWFTPLGIHVTWLSGKQKTGDKKQSLQQIANGKASMVIGTHALIQDEVTFYDLALVIIDEQHRFGVHQRLALLQKGKARKEKGEPHQLIMTATPIPRTLAMSVYADMDCSVIDELPPERLPVTTVLITNNRRQAVIERIATACSDGRQAYWVCTLIEESEALEAKAAEVTAAELRTVLPHLHIGLVHSRIKSDAKAQTIAAFKQGELDLLVATTVIEVGVDVPNASLMVIENPERLGLAQLHQLRGRVGRGGTQSHCVLLYGTPLSTLAKQRLQVLRQSNDGFYIAEEDLRMRGPGEVLGTRQTGELQFKVADLQRDAHLLEQVRSAATLLRRRYPALMEPLVRRWLGHKPAYAQA